jgi:excisionase family DNA binding protein
MADARDYLRAADIARSTGASLRTVRRWIAEEILPSVKVRGMRLVHRKDLERMLHPPLPPLSEAEEEMQG